MSKYFLDTEFIEDGKTIDLISLGIVAEDGREFYRLNSSCDFSKASEWVKENVFPHIPLEFNAMVGKWVYDWTKNDNGKDGFCTSRILLADAIRRFIGDDPTPEFWGYYADYDWVVFCQLFGTMMDLPKGFPMYCRDIKQLCDYLGNPKLPEQGKGEHHALADARWNKIAFDFLITVKDTKQNESI